MTDGSWGELEAWDGTYALVEFIPVYCSIEMGHILVEQEQIIGKNQEGGVVTASKQDKQGLFNKTQKHFQQIYSATADRHK